MTSSYHNAFFPHLCTGRALAPYITVHSEAVITSQTTGHWRASFGGSTCPVTDTRLVWTKNILDLEGQRLHKVSRPRVCLCWRVCLPSNALVLLSLPRY